jgi:DNA-binding IclR family transcriptional regulator
VSSLENALEVLGLLSADQPVLRVGEVGRKFGLPKSSVSRLLHAMSRSALIEREPGGRGYMAGPLSVRLAELYLARHSLLGLIEGALDRLVGTFGFTGYAAALSGPDIVVLRRKQGSYPLRHIREVGARMPAISTVTGRTLLARLPDAEALSRLPGISAGGTDGEEHATVQALLAELGEARRQRAVIGTSVLAPAITLIAAAIMRAGESPIAMTLAFPNLAADEALRQAMVTAMRREASEIGRRVEDPQWAGTD